MPVNLFADLVGGEASQAASAPELLSAEADHRIANSLAIIAGLVSLHGRSLPNDRAMSGREVRGLLDEISARVQTVGRLHRLVASAGRAGDVDIGDYLREISEITLSSLAAGESTSLELVLEPGCTLPAGRAASVGLVASEAISNALKYAHPTGVRGKIQLACRHEQGGLVVEIADDGIGLPEGFDPHRDGSLGFLLMRSLASQLGADLQFETAGIGFCVRLCVPVTPH